MAASKTALKAIKTAIDAGDFTKASTQAHELLKQDVQNYNALMFLGFVEEKLSHLNEAEKALRKAHDLKPQDVQPYKGLIRLYEQQGSAKIDDYHDIVTGLATIYAQQEDRNQCQEVVDKYELFVKKHASRSQYRRALELMLPTSHIYETLEGRVPHPSHTYQRILESSQAEEKEWITRQIGDRRTRLGSTLAGVTAEVNFEAIAKFDVEQNYQNLIDWTQDDEVRHALDQELLQRMLDNLLAMPQELKPDQRDKILNKANGMVIIKQQFALAWDIALEWVDSEDLAEWDPQILHQYIDLFPECGLAKILRGFLYGNASPFPLPTSTDPQEPVQRLSETDQLIMMNEGLEDCKESMLGNRIMAHTYLALNEYQSAAEMARVSAKVYRNAEKSYSLSLQDSLDAVNLILGRSLVVYQSPRHHPEARAIFENILSRKPQLTAALLGIGLIYEEDEDYSEAVKFLARALQRDPTNLRIRLEHAWCRALDNDVPGGLEELEELRQQVEQQESPDLSMKAEVLYRLAYCKWQNDPSPKARKDKLGSYRYLIESLKANSSYAPAYTLLGFYFQDYTRNKQRARVAFQKAFELSTSELSAAEQLAQAFANEAEWDLVELVAQRVVESGKARPAPGSKKKAYSWPYAALGVVQMSRSQYSLSIVSFQHALRISPNDYHSWVGLGESYHNSGRYIAASRAFHKAESIDHGLPPDQSWFAQYMLANVQRELGAYGEAVKAYEDVLEVKPGEFGVLLSLLQTIVDFAWARVRQGHFGHAAELGWKAIETATTISSIKADTFNLWKAVGDACSVLNASKTYMHTGDILKIKELLHTDLNPDVLEILQDVDQVNIDLLTTESQDVAQKGQQLLHAAVLAHKRAINASVNDIHAQAVSWYNLGWAEHDAYTSSSTTSTKHSRHLLKAAVRCFKRAIELEAGNSDFWNALGVATITLNPKVSQHAFIRSLHLNDHSARAWTNLGVLYLNNSEAELANQAFTRAQSTDPEYAAAWIGQGLLATLYGRLEEAAGLFKHANEIADSSSMPAKRHYASSAFDHLLTDTDASSQITNLLQPLFAIRQLQTQSPTDIVTKHFLSLFAERVGEYTTAETNLVSVCEAAETAYEQSESNDSLARFAQAKSDLARQLLAQGNYEPAIESAEFALDVTEDEPSGPSYATQRSKWRLSAQVTAGVSYSYLGQKAESVKMLQAAIETSKLTNKGNRPDPNLTCLLAQVLWATGGDQEREAARNQLFECIDENPDHVGATVLLAIVVLLDNDVEGLEVAKDDLKSLRSSSKVSVLDKLKIAKILAGLLTIKAASGDSGNEVDVAADALNGIMLNPEQPQGWLELAKVSADEYAAEMAAKNALKQIPPGGNVSAEELARTFAVTGRSEDLVQATMLAPWLKEY
ncbi:Superkiller protein 3 [Neophaeococcomyces mojaviensis]|uniref:Superkiller protein 3 n=1 Tax=Neophaeococcomyces mojaviensis TaxID=3383035 RepID=A0ACC3AF51_9EURO|nr:Superkiller protein 3 [Knufia sp. JES_112]